MMLAGIAHEVRNPLGGIELFGGLLKEDLENDPRQASVNRILQELGVLSRVVNDFLDFARRRPLELAPVEASELAFELAGLIEAEASERRVRVRLSVPPLTMQADRPSLQRALLNLLRNAVDAAARDEGEGQVQLSATLDGPSLSWVVDDDGPGVPPPDREKIFTPFFTTKQKGQASV